jgi:hypothetical protein
MCAVDVENRLMADFCEPYENSFLFYKSKELPEYLYNYKRNNHLG